jgi:hypothetical protein
MKRFSLYIALMLFLGSCSLSKKIPQGRKLYNGAEVVIESPNGQFTKKEIESLKPQMTERIAPPTNSMVFGFPFKVWMYYAVGVPKKKKGIRNFLQNKLGQKPVFYEQSYAKLNQGNLVNLTENNGYFKSTISSETISKSYKTGIIYKVDLKPRYAVNQISLDAQDFEVFQKDTVELLKNSILKIGKPYSLDEREPAANGSGHQSECSEIKHKYQTGSKYA